MKRMLFAALLLSWGILATTSSARKTYTLEELESMKKNGVLTGVERFIIIDGEDAQSLTGGKAQGASLMPVVENSQLSGGGLLAYDEIGPTRYLITMAREYYGNAYFWSYIYEENKAKFGHPDKIKPGTTVLIPNLKKYGVNPSNPADLEKARRLGREIYARYGKYIGE